MSNYYDILAKSLDEDEEDDFFNDDDLKTSFKPLGIGNEKSDNIYKKTQKTLDSLLNPNISSLKALHKSSNDDNEIFSSKLDESDHKRHEQIKSSTNSNTVRFLLDEEDNFIKHSLEENLKSEKHPTLSLKTDSDITSDFERPKTRGKFHERRNSVNSDIDDILNPNKFFSQSKGNSDQYMLPLENLEIPEKAYFSVSTNEEKIRSLQSQVDELRKRPEYIIEIVELLKRIDKKEFNTSPWDKEIVEIISRLKSILNILDEKESKVEYECSVSRKERLEANELFIKIENHLIKAQKTLEEERYALQEDYKSLIKKQLLNEEDKQSILDSTQRQIASLGSQLRLFTQNQEEFKEILTSERNHLRDERRIYETKRLELTHDIENKKKELDSLKDILEEERKLVDNNRKELVENDFLKSEIRVRDEILKRKQKEFEEEKAIFFTKEKDIEKKLREYETQKLDIEFKNEEINKKQVELDMREQVLSQEMDRIKNKAKILAEREKIIIEDKKKYHLRCLNCELQASKTKFIFDEDDEFLKREEEFLRKIGVRM